MSKPTNPSNRFRPTSDDRALEETEVEGHRFSSSDEGVKHDVEDVTWDESDETEGHRFYNSDKTIKHDVENVTWDDEDGTEGHATRVRV
jgi:hypothetical protein